jgi:transcriptional regulator with XRE-family HTH domain
MKFDSDVYQLIMGKEIPHCQERHERLVRRFMANYPGKPMTQKEMAEYLGIDEARLSNLISKSKKEETFGKYGKILQGKDVIRCLIKGVYDVRKLGLNTNDKEEALLERLGQLFQRPDLLELIFEATDLGLDVKEIIEPSIKAIKKQRNIVKPLPEDDLPQ